MGKRQRVSPTDDWQQVRLLTTWPEQMTYELIRPVVLFGRPVAERARETGAAERTLYRQADRFDQLGMQGLAPPAKVEKHRRIPEEIPRHSLALKAEHPAFRVEELIQIGEVRFGRRLSHHTVKRILAEGAAPPVTRRRFLPYQASPYDVGSPDLLMIWVRLAPRVGSRGHQRRDFAHKQPRNGPFRGTSPYFRSRVTKRSGEP